MSCPLPLDSLNQASISYGTNETYCSDDEYEFIETSTYME